MNNNDLIDLIKSSELADVDKTKVLYKNISLFQSNEDGVKKFEIIIEMCRKNEFKGDLFHFLSVIADCFGNEIYQKIATEEERKLIELKKIKFIDLQNQYLSTDNDIDIIEKMISLSYELNELSIYFVLLILYNKISKEEISPNHFVEMNTNIGFLKDVLIRPEKKVICLLDVEENHLVNWDVFANLLERLNHEVIILFGNICNEKQDVNLLLQRSIDQREQYGTTFLYPFFYTQDVNTLNETLEFVVKEHMPNDVGLVFGIGSLLERVNFSICKGCEFNKLSPFTSDGMENKICFGWIGDYLEYSSIVHGRDIRADLLAPDEYDFSIVIPVKNTAKSLRFTLQTCLNQKFSGHYEIVISDNSDEENNEIIELVKEIADPHIKYYKASRDYIISKSFESAIFRARGKFIISLGSDDGLFPWSLEVLDIVLKKNEEDILMWDRGQYQWPDFGQGISDRLYFPKGYERGKYELSNIDSLDYFLMAINNPDTMYNLPLLYINSGFKRQFIWKVIQRTGRFMDGNCQDIYMGMINSAIKKTIAYLKYPISMAGMTGSSTGNYYEKALSSANMVLTRIEQLEKVNYVGGRADSGSERLIPPATNAAATCYICALRAISLGVFSKEIITQVIDWENWYFHLISSVKINDLTYEKQIEDILYSAQKHGIVFLTKVKKMIEFSYLQQVKSSQNKNEEKLGTKEYRKVETKDYIILDASEYNVENIVGAVQLVVNMFDL